MVDEETKVREIWCQALEHSAQGSAAFGPALAQRDWSLWGILPLWDPIPLLWLEPLVQATSVSHLNDCLPSSLPPCFHEGHFSV